MANGLDEARALAHAERIRAMNGRYPGLTVLAGIECDILADGSMDLADDCLAALDIVIGSVHSQLGQDEGGDDDPARARRSSTLSVDIIGHLTTACCCGGRRHACTSRR